MIDVLFVSRESGNIVRRDRIEDHLLDQHLCYLSYYWGIDDEGWLDRKAMTMNFYIGPDQGMADIVVLPVLLAEMMYP